MKNFNYFLENINYLKNIDYFIRSYLELKRLLRIISLENMSLENINIFKKLIVLKKYQLLSKKINHFRNKLIQLKVTWL